MIGSKGVITDNIQREPAQTIGVRVPERTVILLDAVGRARGDHCRSMTMRAALDEFITRYVNVKVQSQEDSEPKTTCPTCQGSGDDHRGYGCPNCGGTGLTGGI